MSSVQHLREFISERLTAAAEEIFTEFEKTIVQYEEEMDRQRRLLDITWKPHTHLQAAESSQQFNCKKEVVPDQQLCNQDTTFSLHQEDPEAPQIKVEEEELCSTHVGEQLVLKQETDIVMVTPTHEENISRELKPNNDRLLPQTSPEDKSRDQEGSRQEESGSSRNEEPKNERQTDGGCRGDVDNSLASESQCDPDRNRKPVTCDVCGKTFRENYSMKIHKRIHTGERPYSCKTCGKSFTQRHGLTCHMRSHAGEKPYTCNTCEKSFTTSSQLTAHIRTHTGEKPYSCSTCGKSFTHSGNLADHMRAHTGERPYSCKTCGKSCIRRDVLISHMRVHTGERPFNCEICGKTFTQRGHLNVHIRIHTGEKPFPCEVCGKRFIRNDQLLIHIRTHTGERPISCKICGKCFSFTTSLRVHMRTHAGEKLQPNKVT